MTTPATGDTTPLDPSQLFGAGQEAMDALNAWCLIQDVNAAIERLPTEQTYARERAIFARVIDILANGE
jgi:hypothetical protein